jgi:hypothetical protein
MSTLEQDADDRESGPRLKRPVSRRPDTIPVRVPIGIKGKPALRVAAKAPEWLERAWAGDRSGLPMRPPTTRR